MLPRTRRGVQPEAMTDPAGASGNPMRRAGGIGIAAWVVLGAGGLGTGGFCTAFPGAAGPSLVEAAQDGSTPGSFQDAFAQAREWIAKGDLGQGESLMRRALEYDPQSGDALRALYGVQIRRKEGAAAAATLLLARSRGTELDAGRLHKLPVSKQLGVWQRRLRTEGRRFEGELKDLLRLYARNRQWTRSAARIAQVMLGLGSDRRGVERTLGFLEGGVAAARDANPELEDWFPPESLAAGGASGGTWSIGRLHIRSFVPELASREVMAPWLESLYAALRQAFDVPQDGPILDVSVFEDRESFDKAVAAAGKKPEKAVCGLTSTPIEVRIDPKTNREVGRSVTIHHIFTFDPREADLPRSMFPHILAHEISHAFLQERVLGRFKNPWLNEAIAGYFEEFHVLRSGEVLFGVPRPRRLATVRYVFGKGTPSLVEELAKEELAGEDYVVGWSWMQYLLHRDEGILGPDLDVLEKILTAPEEVDDWMMREMASSREAWLSCVQGWMEETRDPAEAFVAKVLQRWPEEDHATARELLFRADGIRIPDLRVLREILALARRDQDADLAVATALRMRAWGRARGGLPEPDERLLDTTLEAMDASGARRWESARDGYLAAVRGVVDEAGRMASPLVATLLAKKALTDAGFPDVYRSWALDGIAGSPQEPLPWPAREMFPEEGFPEWELPPPQLLHWFHGTIEGRVVRARLGAIVPLAPPGIRAPFEAECTVKVMAWEPFRKNAGALVGVVWDSQGSGDSICGAIQAMPARGVERLRGVAFGNLAAPPSWKPASVLLDKPVDLGEGWPDTIHLRLRVDRDHVRIRGPSGRVLLDRSAPGLHEGRFGLFFQNVRAEVTAGRTRALP